MKSRGVVIALIAAVVALLGVSGCSTNAVPQSLSQESLTSETPTGEKTAGDMTVNGEVVTTKPEVDAASAAGGKLPPQFPDDFPIYSGAQVDVGSSIPDAGGTVFYVNLITSDSVDAVYKWYEAKMKPPGWVIAIPSPPNADSGTYGTFVIAEKKGTGTSSTMIIQDGDRTRINIQVNAN